MGETPFGFTHIRVQPNAVVGYKPPAFQIEKAGRPVGGAVESGIVNVVWTAGGALGGGAVEGGAVNVVWTAGSTLVGGAVEGGVIDVVCATGGRRGRHARRRSRAVDGQGGGHTRKAVVKHAPGFAPSERHPEPQWCWPRDGAPKRRGEENGKRLVARFLRERWRWGQRRQRSETSGGFFLSGQAFMWKLPVAGARRWKGDALVVTARRCFFEAGGGELTRDGGQGGRARALVDPTPDWHLRGAGSQRVQAGSGQGTPCALTSIVWWFWNRGTAEGIAGGAAVGGRRKGRLLFGARLTGSSASDLKLRREAVGRGRCPSQKGSGAEAVCLEWNAVAPLHGNLMPQAP
ncbi:hypothetical protein DFH08DRAFT_795931 [Mycena albidolilacea]|uniref:Uncharacterized protein n=1 Tax=Mycena albidolilacea TaxID=1033008 RepID=A0AAD7F3R5_9AGAR|nr:hypothetical protein DFH08DRAFT_795931 [Mycena albidolilacea]